RYTIPQRRSPPAPLAAHLCGSNQPALLAAPQGSRGDGRGNRTGPSPPAHAVTQTSLPPPQAQRPNGSITPALCSPPTNPLFGPLPHEGLLRTAIAPPTQSTRPAATEGDAMEREEMRMELPPPGQPPTLPPLTPPAPQPPFPTPAGTDNQNQVGRRRKKGGKGGKGSAHLLPPPSLPPQAPLLTPHPAEPAPGLTPMGQPTHTHPPPVPSPPQDHGSDPAHAPSGCPSPPLNPPQVAAAAYVIGMGADERRDATMADAIDSSSHTSHPIRVGGPFPQPMDSGESQEGSREQGPYPSSAQPARPTPPPTLPALLPLPAGRQVYETPQEVRAAISDLLAIQSPSSPPDAPTLPVPQVRTRTFAEVTRSVPSFTPPTTQLGSSLPCPMETDLVPRPCHPHPDVGAPPPVQPVTDTLPVVQEGTGTGLEVSAPADTPSPGVAEPPRGPHPAEGEEHTMACSFGSPPHLPSVTTRPVRPGDPTPSSVAPSPPLPTPLLHEVGESSPTLLPGDPLGAQANHRVPCTASSDATAPIDPTDTATSPDQVVRCPTCRSSLANRRALQHHTPFCHRADAARRAQAVHDTTSILPSLSQPRATGIQFTDAQWQTLDSVDWTEYFSPERIHARPLRRVPERVRGGYLDVLSAILARIAQDPEAAGPTFLLAAAPTLFLAPATPPDRSHTAAIATRVSRFGRGEWDELLPDALGRHTPLPRRTGHRSRTATDPSTADERRIARCLCLAACNETSRACAALESAEAAPDTQGTIQRLRSKHPTAERPTPAWLSGFQGSALVLSVDHLRRAIFTAPRGSSGGPSGWVAEHLRDTFLAFPQGLHFLLAVYQQWLRGRCAPAARSLPASSTLVALAKSNMDVRPIAIGEVLALQASPEFQCLIPFIGLFYGTPPNLHYRSVMGVVTMHSECGTRQGDPLSPFLYTLTHRLALEPVLTEGDVQLWSYADDMDLEAFTSLGIKIARRGLTVTGVPVGTVSFVEHSLPDRLERMGRVLPWFPRLHQPQTAARLLSACVSTRPQYLTRTVPPSPAVISSFTRWDTRLGETFQQLLALGTWACREDVREAALDQIFLPIRLGGFGIRRMARIAPVSYVCSWVQCAPILCSLPACGEVFRQSFASGERAQIDQALQTALEGLPPDVLSLLPFWPSCASASPNSLFAGASRLLEAHALEAVRARHTSPLHLARLTNLQGVGAGALLQSVPYADPLRIPEAQWQVASSSRFGLPIPQLALTGQCPCGQAIDDVTVPHHAVRCPRFGVAMTIHDTVKFMLRDFAVEAGFAVKVEDSMLFTQLEAARARLQGQPVVGEGTRAGGLLEQRGEVEQLGCGGQWGQHHLRGRVARGAGGQRGQQGEQTGRDGEGGQQRQQKGSQRRPQAQGAAPPGLGSGVGQGREQQGADGGTGGAAGSGGEDQGVREVAGDRAGGLGGLGEGREGEERGQVGGGEDRERETTREEAPRDQTGQQPAQQQGPVGRTSRVGTTSSSRIPDLTCRDVGQTLVDLVDVSIADPQWEGNVQLRRATPTQIGVAAARRVQEKLRHWGPHLEGLQPAPHFYACVAETFGLLSEPLRQFLGICAKRIAQWRRDRGGGDDGSARIFEAGLTTRLSVALQRAQAQCIIQHAVRQLGGSDDEWMPTPLQSSDGIRRSSRGMIVPRPSRAQTGTHPLPEPPLHSHTPCPLMPSAPPAPDLRVPAPSPPPLTLPAPLGARGPPTGRSLPPSLLALLCFRLPRLPFCRSKPPSGGACFGGRACPSHLSLTPCLFDLPSGRQCSCGQAIDDMTVPHHAVRCPRFGVAMTIHDTVKFMLRDFAVEAGFAVKVEDSMLFTQLEAARARLQGQPVVGEGTRAGGLLEQRGEVGQLGCGGQWGQHQLRGRVARGAGGQRGQQGEQTGRDGEGGQQRQQQGSQRRPQAQGVAPPGLGSGVGQWREQQGADGGTGGAAGSGGEDQGVREAAGDQAGGLGGLGEGREGEGRGQVGGGEDRGRETTREEAPRDQTGQQPAQQQGPVGRTGRVGTTSSSRIPDLTCRDVGQTLMVLVDVSIADPQREGNVQLRRATPTQIGVAAARRVQEKLRHWGPHLEGLQPAPHFYACVAETFGLLSEPLRQFLGICAKRIAQRRRDRGGGDDGSARIFEAGLTTRLSVALQRAQAQCIIQHAVRQLGGSDDGWMPTPVPLSAGQTLPNNASPHLLWTGKLGTTKLFRVFGCVVQYRPPTAPLRKFDQRAKWGLHLGIEKQYFAWHIMDYRSRLLVPARDCIFYENLTLPVFEQHLASQQNPATLFHGVRSFANADVEIAASKEPDSDGAREAAPDPPVPVTSSGIPEFIPLADAAPEDVREVHHTYLVDEQRQPMPVVSDSSIHVNLDEIGGASGDQNDSVNFAGRTDDNAHYQTGLQILGLAAAVQYSSTENLEPKTARQALSGPHREKWREAMDRELAALEKRGTWDLIPIENTVNKNVLTGKWVFRVKTKADGTYEKHKARWVVRGFDQTHGIDYTLTFAPVSRHTSLDDSFPRQLPFATPPLPSPFPSLLGLTCPPSPPVDFCPGPLLWLHHPSPHPAHPPLHHLRFSTSPAPCHHSPPPSVLQPVPSLVPHPLQRSVPTLFPSFQATSPHLGFYRGLPTPCEALNSPFQPPTPPPQGMLPL
ncbi:unnamed protein product, partial [Closterium sp. NIES-53]